MLTGRRPRAAVLFACMLPEVVAATKAWAQVTGNITQVGYYVNISTFNSFYSQDVTRILENAARQWAWAGGARTVLENEGTTTWAGCGIGNPNHIWAKAGCDPALGCGACAVTQSCPFGGWEIYVYPQACSGGGNSTIQPMPTPGTTDLQTVVEHEFGHSIGLSHENIQTPCIMNPVTPPHDRSHRFFCQEEISQAESVDGSPTGPAFVMTQWTGWPSFSTTGWQTDFAIGNAQGGALNYGRGVGMIMRSETLDSFAWTDIVSGEVQFCSYWPSACSPSGGPGDSWSWMRPSVALDTRRNRWWFFWRDGLGSANNTENEIMYSATSDFVNWTNPAPIEFQGLVNPTSRMPVGAAYDQYSDSIVVVFANWNTTGDGTYTCTYPYGCSGELNVGTLPAGTTGSPSVWTGPSDLGYVVTGPPALACEYSGTDFECQVLATDEDFERHIMSLMFGLYVNGTLYGVDYRDLFGVEDTGGWTDYPIGLTFNGATEQGNFVAIVTDANPSGALSILQKPVVEQDWEFPWQSLSGSPNTHLGPTIRIREADKNYDVVYAN